MLLSKPRTKRRPRCNWERSIRPLFLPSKLNAFFRTSSRWFRTFPPPLGSSLLFFALFLPLEPPASSLSLSSGVRARLLDADALLVAYLPWSTVALLVREGEEEEGREDFGPVDVDWSSPPGRDLSGGELRLGFPLLLLSSLARLSCWRQVSPSSFPVFLSREGFFLFARQIREKKEQQWEPGVQSAKIRVQ